MSGNQTRRGDLGQKNQRNATGALINTGAYGTRGLGANKTDALAAPKRPAWNAKLHPGDWLDRQTFLAEQPWFQVAREEGLEKRLRVALRDEFDDFAEYLDWQPAGYGDESSAWFQEGYKRFGRHVVGDALNNLDGKVWYTNDYPDGTRLRLIEAFERTGLRVPLGSPGTWGTLREGEYLSISGTRLLVAVNPETGDAGIVDPKDGSFTGQDLRAAVKEHAERGAATSVEYASPVRVPAGPPEYPNSVTIDPETGVMAGLIGGVHVHIQDESDTLPEGMTQQQVNNYLETARQKLIWHENLTDELFHLRPGPVRSNAEYDAVLNERRLLLRDTFENATRVEIKTIQRDEESALRIQIFDQGDTTTAFIHANKEGCDVETDGPGGERVKELFVGSGQVRDALVAATRFGVHRLSR